MKPILVPIVCVLSLAAALTLEPRAGRPPAAAESAAAQQQPAPAAPTPTPVQEWKPAEQGIYDLTERSLEEAVGPRRRISIVGERYSPTEFANYIRDEVVRKIRAGGGAWRPQFLVLHHTGIPSIAQRPQGFSKQNMKDLAYYYGVKQRRPWKSGPHLFVDQNGIWVFSHLTKPGTHSPTWNPVSWGIEQLGNFTDEDYNSGDGAKIRDNSIAALAILTIASEKSIDGLRLHKEDPNTSHKSCPGSSCKQDKVIEAVKAEIPRWEPIVNRR